MLDNIDAGVPNVTFEVSGAPDGWPVVLLHGFPYDIHAYDEVVPILVSNGARVITPYLRGFCPTRFLNDNTLRTGQQAAIGHDLLELVNALQLGPSCLVGDD